MQSESACGGPSHRRSLQTGIPNLRTSEPGTSKLEPWIRSPEPGKSPNLNPEPGTPNPELRVTRNPAQSANILVACGYCWSRTSRTRPFIAKGLREASYAVDVAADGSVAAGPVPIKTTTMRSSSTSCCPGRDGLTVCGKLRAAGRRPGADADRARCGRARVGGSTPAPTIPHQAVRFSRAARARPRLTRRRPLPVLPERIEVGPLAIDIPAQRRAGRDGAQIELTSPRVRAARISRHAAPARSSAAPRSPNTSGTNITMPSRISWTSIFSGCAGSSIGRRSLR